MVRSDAASCGVSVPLAWSMAALPLVGGFLIAATYFHWPLFIWILREDHPVEWAQFALCLITSLMAAMISWRFSKHGQWLLATVFILVALGALVLGGEEISWAQRALAYSTPEEMRAKNDQEEFNVHNLTEGGFDVAELFKLFEMVMGLGGMILPFLTRLDPPRVRRPLAISLSSPLFLVPCFAFAFFYRLLRFVLDILGMENDAMVAFTEWAEMDLYLGLAGLMIFTYAATREPIGGRHSHTDPTGELPQGLPFYPSVVTVVTSVTLLTLVLAVMTMASGVLPGNVG